MRRGHRRNLSVGVVLAAVAVLGLVMALPKGAPEEPAQASTQQASCADGVEQVLVDFAEDPLKCISQALGLTPGEGETVTAYLTWGSGSGWEQRGSTLKSDSTGYGATSHAEGTENIEIEIYSQGRDEPVFRKSLTRDAAFGLLEVDLINLPGADTIRVIDANGTVYNIEVA